MKDDIKRYIAELESAVSYLYEEVSCGADDGYMDEVNSELSDSVKSLLEIE